MLTYTFRLWQFIPKEMKINASVKSKLHYKICQESLNPLFFATFCFKSVLVMQMDFLGSIF